MAQSTLAERIKLIKNAVDQTMIYDAFIKPDRFTAGVPVDSSRLNGVRWEQTFRASNDAAAGIGFSGTATRGAITTHTFNQFLFSAHRGAQYNIATQSLGNSPVGWNQKQEEKQGIFDALGLEMREWIVSGEPATVTIGADITALGVTAVEPGPRTLEFENVHPQNATPTTTAGSLKWTLATNALQYKAPGDSYYGPAVTVSATNCYRIALYSGANSANAPNIAKWIRLTVTWATISVSANFESDTTAAKTIVFTPTLDCHGLVRLCSPRQTIYGDLTGAQTAAGTATMGNGPPSGSVLTRPALSWLRTRLLDAARGDASRCFMLAPENLINGSLEGMITHLGHGVDPVMFMGSELYEGHAYGGIPFFQNDYVPTNLTSSDGTTGLTQVIGGVLGVSEGIFMKSMNILGDVNLQQVNEVMSGGVATGTDAQPGTPMPVQYFEQKASTSQLEAYMDGYLFMEMTGSLNALATVTHIINQ